MFVIRDDGRPVTLRLAGGVPIHRQDGWSEKQLHRAYTVRCRRLDVHLLVKAGSRQLREPGSIMWIGLVRLHRLEALVRLPCIDASDRDTQLAQASRDPRRHPARSPRVPPGHEVPAARRSPRACCPRIAPRPCARRRRRRRRTMFPLIGLFRHSVSWLLPSFRSNNQKVRRSAGPRKRPQITR